MEYNLEEMEGRFKSWADYLNEYNLPEWDDIPNFGLYMDQVLQIIDEYTASLPSDIKDEQKITAAAINNYVRLGVIPKPDKKKYYRHHIAYILFIHLLKQTMPIQTIAKVFPVSDEEITRVQYENFQERYKACTDFITNLITSYAPSALGFLSTQSCTIEDPDDLAIDASIVGGVCSLLAQKIISLREASATERE